MENNEGNAEIMGVVLLISIFVAAVGLMGVMMLSAPQPEKVPAVAFDFWTDNDNTSISLIHRGGETLNLSGAQLKIIYSNGTSTENPAVSIDWGQPQNWSAISTSYLFHIGDSITFNATKSIDQVQLIWPGTGGASMTGGGGAVLLGAWSPNGSSGRVVPAAVTDAVLISSQNPEQSIATMTPNPGWDLPDIFFFGNPTVVASGSEVQFNVTTLNGSHAATSYNWSFGDGYGIINLAPQNANITHPYNTAEGSEYTVYGVTLTGSLNDGRSRSFTRENYITVYNPPVASFTMNVTSGQSPLAVGFTDTSRGYQINSWNWDFGDGTTSPTTTERDVTHIYTYAGTYTITQNVTNVFGQSATTTRTITIIAPITAQPHADFRAATIGIGGLMAPRTVQFTDISTGSPTNWLWVFGDGTSNSTEQNPIHIYTNAGTYTVTLIISNQYGSDSTSKTISVITTMEHTISGTVYNDLNRINSHPDPNEPGLAGWTVSLYKQGSTVTTTTTGADGSYMFTGLEKNNNYVVSLSLPAGWQYTTPRTGSYKEGMNGNQDAPNTDFGVFQAPLSGNFVLNANRPGYLVAGTYLQFRFISSNPGHIDINTNPTNLAVNDVVKIVLESNQSGIIGTNSGIYVLNLQNVSLHITRNGIPLPPSPRGAITGFSVNSFDQYQSSTLGVIVPYYSAQYAFSVGGTTIISSYNSPYDTRSIQLYNVSPQSDGQLNLNVGSAGSYIYTGYVGSCQLLP